jgi:hypothetical protein
MMVLKADGGQFLLPLDRPGLLELRQAILDGARVVRHPLEAALGQQSLLTVRQVKQAVLQRRGTKIGDQDLHVLSGIDPEDLTGRTATSSHFDFPLPPKVIAAIYPVRTVLRAAEESPGR